MKSGIISILLAGLLATVAFAAEPGGDKEPKPAEPAGTEIQPKWIWRTSDMPGKAQAPVEADAPAKEVKPVKAGESGKSAQSTKIDEPFGACFRRIVTIPVGAKLTTAVLAVTTAGKCQVYVNGTLIGDKFADWQSVWGVRLAKHLKPGRNVLAIISGVSVPEKKQSAAGLIGRLTVNFERGAPLEIVTDRQWKVSSETAVSGTTFDLDDTSWAVAQELGPIGIKPWGTFSLEPSPRTVTWPVVPATRPLTREQADSLLEADWLKEVANDPTVKSALEEIEAARRLAQRLAAHPKKPDFTAELAELTQLATIAQGITREWDAEAEVSKLYLSVRRVKRQIMFRNPVIDFERLLLIDGTPPVGHESGHRTINGAQAGKVLGSRLLVLDALRPDANARDVIPDDSHHIMRMDLSFDASKLVYSRLPRSGKSYHLYEVSLDANGMAIGKPRQLTNSPYDDQDPVYLPDGKLAFCTTRGNTYVRCVPDSACTVLARCDADGKNIRILSGGNEPDFTPCVLPDGRILYTRWEYTERPLWRLQKLWTINPDGTGLAHYWGNGSQYPDVVWEARPMPGTDRVMFTGTGHHYVDGGPIGIVDPKEGRDYPNGLYKVTAEAVWTEVNDPGMGGPSVYTEKLDPGMTNRIFSTNYRTCRQYKRFESPYPLGSHDFLVSARGSAKEIQRFSGVEGSIQKGWPYWLYLMDVDGNRELVYAGTSEGGVWCAMPLRPRVKPPVIPDRVRWPAVGEKAEPGVLYSANVYEGVDGVPPGTAKFLRVWQHDYKTYSMGGKTLRNSGPAISALQEDSVKRILGTVPIQDNGSVSFKVPAGQMLNFQLLDADQRCIQIMRSFTNVMPGEVRGCMGCHEGHDKAPPPTVGGRQYQPVELTPPPWGAEVSISYERFAQPVLDKHCGQCHQGDGKGRAVLDLTLRGGFAEKLIQDPKLFPGKEPYLTLIGDTNWGPEGSGGWGRIKKGPGYGLAGAMPVESNIRDSLGPLKPMSTLSYKSPLIELAMSGKHHGVKIVGEDLLRLIAWIDSSCVYRGDDEVRQIPDPAPGRQPVPYKTRTAPVIDRLQPVTDPSASPQ